MSNFNNYKIVGFKKNNTIFCRNFFIFLLLMRYRLYGNNIKTNFFIKPKYKNVITFIRSPYRYKLARHQVFIQRYEIQSNISFFLKKSIVFSNLNELFYFYESFKNISGYFETNMVYQHKSYLNFDFFLKDYFFLKNYK